MTGDKNAYLSASKIYEGSMMLGMIDKTQYDIMMNTIKNLYEGRGESFQHLMKLLEMHLYQQCNLCY